MRFCWGGKFVGVYFLATKLASHGVVGRCRSGCPEKWLKYVNRQYKFLSGVRGSIWGSGSRGGGGRDALDKSISSTAPRRGHGEKGGGWLGSRGAQILVLVQQLRWTV